MNVLKGRHSDTDDDDESLPSLALERIELQRSGECTICTSLLLLAFMIIATEAACIDSYTNNTIYTDKTISYIESNKATSTIYYLGTKSSATQCRDSCIDFNYLCDKSSSYILYNDANLTFNNNLCSITISANTNKKEAYIKITDEPILSSNYIIEVELTHSIGDESGLYWKSNNDVSADESNYYDYYFAIDPTTDNCITGYSDPTEMFGYKHLSKEPPKPNFNTRHSLSATVNGNSFSTALNGEQHYSGTLRSSYSSYGYAGIWSVSADAIFHSFKITFPSGESEEKICAAYLLDSSNRCYGYYGTDFTTIESSLSYKKNYSSGVLYACSTIQPTTVLLSTALEDVKQETELTDAYDTTDIDDRSTTSSDAIDIIQYVICGSSVVVLCLCVVIFVYCCCGKKRRRPPQKGNMYVPKPQHDAAKVTSKTNMNELGNMLAVNTVATNIMVEDMNVTKGRHTDTDDDDADMNLVPTMTDESEGEHEGDLDLVPTMADESEGEHASDLDLVPTLGNDTPPAPQAPPDSHNVSPQIVNYMMTKK